MLILDEPYISPFLQKTCKKNNFEVLENDMSKSLNINTISQIDALNKYANLKKPKIYTNSENSINWILKNLSNTGLPSKITLFKDKNKFRALLKEIYPNFYFKEFDFSELINIKNEDLKYPFVIKPTVGFLSMGVYTVYDADDWKFVLENIKDDMEKCKGLFPLEVMDSRKFIIEDYIDGDEYAIDAYFDKNGQPIILNIFNHPFSNEKDVSDRIYVSSAKIIKENLSDFTALLSKIGELSDLKNFPLHIEVRVDKKGTIPIEVNPLRFAGWCTTDLAYFAYGINVYEYFYNDKKPDWEKILADKRDEIYYFTMVGPPREIDKNAIKAFDKEEFLNHIKNPLEIREYDFKTKPLFAVVFAKTIEMAEIKRLLVLDVNKLVL